MIYTGLETLDLISMIEGIGSEVLVTLLISVVVFFALLKFVVQNNESQTQNGSVERPTPFNQGCCPICIEELQLPVETNCGHMFCGNCLMHSSNSRSIFLELMDCPLCRQQVTILFLCFTPCNLEQAETVDSAREIENFCLSYNRFAQSSDSIWGVIRNTPILLRHFFTRVMVEGFDAERVLVNGMFIITCFVMYVVIPYDFLPENVYGIIGFLDDVAVALGCCVYVGFIYRQALAAARQTSE